MKPVPLEDYVTEIGACTSADKAFAVFRREVEAEGFQNVVFVRFMPSGEHEVPFIELPDEFPRVYLGENFFETDPVLLSLKLRSRPFTWADMMRDHDWGKSSRQVFGACGELGAKNGFTIPFHAPGGRCDFFSLSFRDKRTIDPRRLTIINLKAYATWQRFNEFDSIRQALVYASASNMAPDGQLEPLADCSHRDETSVEISAQECHAIVATDVAHKRYKAGFTEFNATLPLALGKKLVDRLMRRGLIYEEPDDDAWRFVYRPSAIARAHLNSCPAVPYHRDEVCTRHIRKDERPSIS